MDASVLARTSFFLSTIPMGGEATSSTSTASATTSQYQFVKRNTRRAPSYQVPRVNYAAPAKNLSVKIPWKWQWDAGIIHISFISCGAFAVARSARHPSRLIAGFSPNGQVRPGAVRKTFTWWHAPLPSRARADQLDLYYQLRCCCTRLPCNSFSPVIHMFDSERASDSSPPRNDSDSKLSPVPP